MITRILPIKYVYSIFLSLAKGQLHYNKTFRNFRCLRFVWFYYWEIPLSGYRDKKVHFILSQYLFPNNVYFSKLYNFDMT